MAYLRWGSDTPRDADAARNRILDAASACFIRFGSEKTKFDDIAAMARVSRATVYRYFPGRDQLILALALRELQAAIEEMTTLLAGEGHLTTRLVEASTTGMERIRRSELMSLLSSASVGDLAATVIGDVDILWQLGIRFLLPFLEAAHHDGELRVGLDPQHATELLLRVGASLILHRGPNMASATDEQAFLHSVVAGMTRD